MSSPKDHWFPISGKSAIVWGLLEQCHDKRPGGLMKGKASLLSNICLVKVDLNESELVDKKEGSQLALLPTTT